MNKEIRAIIADQIMRHVPASKEHRAWLANDIADRVERAISDSENAKLHEVCRENIISARIIKAENDQRGHIHGIDRDAKFIIERTEAVLSTRQIAAEAATP